MQVLSTYGMRLLLVRTASWFDLPSHGGKPWRLATHQGRKTFVRFAALRDRSALFALAQHLGHRERGITDTSYVGTDYRLNDEIDAAILDQSVSAWEQMLSARALGGRGGGRDSWRSDRDFAVRDSNRILNAMRARWSMRV